MSSCGSPSSSPPTAAVISVWIDKLGLVSGFWTEQQSQTSLFAARLINVRLHRWLTNDRTARRFGINNLMQLHVGHESSHRNSRSASDVSSNTREHASLKLHNTHSNTCAEYKYHCQITEHDSCVSRSTLEARYEPDGWNNPDYCSVNKTWTWMFQDNS